MPFSPLSKEEIALHRAEASKGNTPSLEIVGRFIATIRKAWNAKPKEKTEGKSRVSKPKADENQIDFF